MLRPLSRIVVVRGLRLGLLGDYRVVSCRLGIRTGYKLVRNASALGYAMPGMPGYFAGSLGRASHDALEGLSRVSLDTGCLPV